MKNILEYKRALAITGGALLSVSTACWGYVYGVSETEAKQNEAMDHIIAAEVERTRKYYALRYKDFMPEDVSEMDSPPKDIVVAERQVAIPSDMLNTPEGRQAVMADIQRIVDQESTVVVNNEPHEDRTSDSDIAQMIANRSDSAPYIISFDEYMMNSPQYECFDLTFFEGDGALLDESDENIPDIEQVVGEDNMQHFGVMSNDNNTVYIQNDASMGLFRVTRNFQTASEAIYGAVAAEDATLEHSSMRRRRPRRED